MSINKNTGISRWLTLLCFGVIAMVFIGGITRLSGSGLSITKWKLVSGILPPLSHEAWIQEFDDYKVSPEFQKVNQDFDLREFKSIFWLEYIHRLIGRLVGLLFILPYIYFIWCGSFSKKKFLAFTFIGALFAAQGYMGWYMVKSGLVDDPHVSHFRLAAHLMIATLIFILIFWQKMCYSFDIMLVASEVNICRLKRMFMGAIVLCMLQMFFGVLVAGTQAGLIYNTYPLMNGELIASEITLDRLFTFNALSDPVTLQFIHRLLAIILLIYIITLSVACRNTQISKLKSLSTLLIFSILVQLTLGILTLIYMVPISYAVSHQLGAFLVLSSLLWGLFLSVKA